MLQRSLPLEGLSQGCQIDGSDITMPSLKALSLLEDLVEVRMRDNWVAAHKQPELERPLKLYAASTKISSLH